MAEEQVSSRLRLPWKTPAQKVARRDSAHTPFEWRSTFRSRVLVCAGLLAAWTVGIEARLIYLQVVAYSEMTAMADDQQLMTVEPAPERGDILDRNGRLLAYSVDAYTIGADPKHVEDAPKAVRLVCEVLGCDGKRQQALEKSILAAMRSGRRYVVIERQASPGTADRIHALGLTGIGFYAENKRYYPNKTLAAHLLGFVGIDNEGLAGLELAFDKKIRGNAGRLLLQADARRKIIGVRKALPATAGDSLELTIDQYLQRIAERELKAGVDEHNARGGTVVIQDPNTGAILALANYPTFNPNVYRVSTPEDRKNRAIQDVYEPGSTFKLVTASAAIEERLFRTSDMIDCAPGWIKFEGRKPIRDVHTYGELSFEDVIVKSSNVGAIKAGLRVGAERLSLYVSRFGFGQVLSPDFRGQTAGLWNPQGLDASGLASVAMGYQIGVTPLQMAAAVSSVANGGTLYEPRLIGAFIHNGRREPVAAKALRRTVSAETAATLTGIMEAVVERGTAKAAQIEGFTIAGKTGTAAKIVDGRYSDSDYNTSFIGFAPSRKPALTVIVVIDSPHGKVARYGGTVAAPIFQRITAASLRHLGIGPNVNAPSPVVVARADSPDESRAWRAADDRAGQNAVQAAVSGSMPDLRGLSSREATHSLIRLGLVPRLSGSGFVMEQSPEPGAMLVPGETATLKLVRTAPKHLRAAPTPAALPPGGPQ